MVHVLGGGEALEEFDAPRRPSGDVAGQLLQHRHGPLAAAVAQGVGHVAAQVDVGFADGLDRRDAEQIANIGHHPRLAGLDEPVVVELVDVPLDGGEFGVDDGQQRPERAVVLGVAGSVEGGEQVVQAVAAGHVASVNRAPAGASSSNSAGWMAPDSHRNRRAATWPVAGSDRGRPGR